MSDDHGLGLKVHEDAYRELEEKLAKQKAKLEEIGSRACCVLLERDAARHQRDMLADALEMVRDADEDCHKDGLPTMPPAARCTIDKALAAVKGGKP